MNATPFPTSYGRFNEGGDFSNSPPVNFLHGLFDESSDKDYFVENGIINQDYVNQFDSLLKDSKGNLKSGDDVIQNALNKYMELKNRVLNSNSTDAENQIGQIENSLNWSVGTSLNAFASGMTQSNTWLVRTPTYNVDKRDYYLTSFSNGGITTTSPDELFSVNNSTYVTATNIVFSAAKLIEKGIDYINNNQYDPENSDDAEKLLEVMNNGTNDADSSNLSLSTLTNVISTFRDFIYAPDNFVLSNANKLAQDAPSSDIAAIYTNMKDRLNFIVANREKCTP